MALHRLDRAQARRIAIRAQLLNAPRPTDLLSMVQHLTLLQVDPTAAIAPNAELVAWTRLGSSHDHAEVTQALEVDRTLVEFKALIRPMADVGLYLADASDWPPTEAMRAWLADNDSFRRDILDLLGQSGPLLSRDIPDTSVVPWPSTGWTNNRNVTQMLEFLVRRGEVAVTARRGKQRIWDLADRVYPTDLPTFTAEEAERIRDERRLTALGIARGTGTAVPVEPALVGEAGEPAEVEGTPGVWRVDPSAIGQPFEGRTALLSPFDRLIHDRGRAVELFDFEYTLEMYKPKDKRRWGYFALPVLHGDQLVGKLDALAERKAGVLRVNAIHQDVRFTKAISKGIDAELEDLATWIGLTAIERLDQTT